VLLPALDAVIDKLREMAQAFAAVPMLSRTHGQTASPTTVGKEIANVVVRLKLRAKNCQHQADGQDERRGGQLQRPPVRLARLDWEAFSRKVIETPEPMGLGLTFQPYSIQIEPHDYMAELFDAIARTNTILIDWSRDVWGYVSWATSNKSSKKARWAHPPCRTRSTRLILRTPKATWAWPTRAAPPE
jgi:adenylosuccinate lyase